VTQVKVPKNEPPLVSVVMVLYGGWEIARRAMAALVENTDPYYELILVDNASPDDTATRVDEEVVGARVILNETNRGFGVASNQGAEQSHGRYLCLLNSDTLVQPGWLAPLLETLEGDPTVGAAVPLLLNEDGSIQEAGCVVDSIGHAHAVGSDGDPGDFQYRFRREVDFGSAACMVVGRDVFADVGGFDPAYAPAYFEDVDLCFKLRARGLRTIYEPRSRVVHVRFGSGSFESARNLMEKNRHLFVERWGERLAQRPRLLEVAQYPHQMLAARDADALERFLVIDDRVPFHDRGSGDPRMAQLLTELAALWPSARITFLAADGQDAQRYAEPLLRGGIEVVCPPVDWKRWFEVHRFHYSVAIVSRHSNIARYEGYLSQDQPQALRIFDTEALTFRRLERLAELLPPGPRANEVWAEAIQTRAIEIQAVQEADVILCVSDEEVEFIGGVAPGKPAFVLPAIVDPARGPNFDERSDLIFFGGFLAGPGSPNEDAVQYLVSDVLPLFWEEHPDVVLNIVGADATPAVHALEGPRVKVIGYVDDPAEWLHRARVHVNPMRFGAGVKLKLLDSMGAGLPFVTSPVGAEGLQLGDLRSALVAQEPAQLARLTATLYTKRQEWERAQTALLQISAAHFDRGSFQRTLIDALSHVGVAPPPGLSKGMADLAV
jgi:GT2 family glycosyltransferase